MRTEAIRVLLADDQALIRGGLAALLDLEADISVVAQLDSGAGVAEAVREHAIDVAVLDIEMPEVDGLTAAEELRAARPDCAVLIVTTFGRAGYLRRALEAGVRGFVVKDTPAEELAEAVRRVASGASAFDPDLLAESLSAGRNPLTDRERQVLRAALDGSPVRQIAKALFLSPGTVRNHLSAAIGKVHASTRAEAAAIARDRGWL
ncbi:LuxR family two component transcriptional regulator [Brevibacterium sanguinis]|uniref:LuxR family two component transcriptional regulator n=2 Tax=Brevibacterium TaxID=1696 RepID=A0A366IH04_9MICO|nr:MULTISPECIES: response regulator transcription factor [Brevibacterium]RBP61616.1 LuxR family two component transcriptional regulator [Brevibacterium sanguinis]RBP70868.1 LuxR family two component transcriptional regulator [Brevibacterium celere]